MRINKFLTVLCFVFVCFSCFGFVAFPGGGGTSEVVCDDCSGDLSFAFHFENSDTVTEGSPCGCSDGDTVGVRNDSAVYDSNIKSDGSYSLDAADKFKFIHFDNDLVGAEEIVAEAAGTIIFDVYFESTTNARLVQFSEDTGGNTDTLYVLLDGGNDIKVWYFGNGVSVGVASLNSISQTTWHTITVKWQAAGDPNLYVDVDGGSSDTDNTDLTALEDKWEWIRFGECGQGEGDLHIDNVKIYKTYQ